MNNQGQDSNEKEIVSDFFVPDREKIKLLQAILEAESGQFVKLEYAQEVGIELISFYECLARDRTIVHGEQDHVSRQ